jgi:hypothetical protein
MFTRPAPTPRYRRRSHAVLIDCGRET